MIHLSVHTCLFLYTHPNSACTFLTLLLAKILPVVSCNFSLCNCLKVLKQISLFPIWKSFSNFVSLTFSVLFFFIWTIDKTPHLVQNYRRSSLNSIQAQLSGFPEALMVSVSSVKHPLKAHDLPECTGYSLKHSNFSAPTTSVISLSVTIGLLLIIIVKFYNLMKVYANIWNMSGKTVVSVKALNKTINYRMDSDCVR